MARAVIFPKLGQTMEEGAIVRWLKKEGDQVAKGDILFEIETDKANLEVESFFEGTLIKIVVGEGVTVPVNTVVGYIGAPGEKPPETPPPAAPPPAAAKSPSAGAADRPSPAVAPPPAEGPPSPPVAPPARPAVSPRARALARECAIDPAKVRGSGPGGRVVERDVRAYLAKRGYDRLRISPAARALARQEGIDILAVRGSGDGGRIMTADIERAVRCKPRPLSRMRQVIARRLAESKRAIPHFYVTVAADVTELLRLRAELKAGGSVWSINDFVLAAAVRALEEFPALNSTTDGQTVSWRGDVDLGVAVSVEDGLVVPVVRAAQLLTPAELRDQVRALVAKARAGRLAPDDMTGGSFTVSNMGMLDVENFAAIVNPGEAAILAVASARETPAAVKGEIRLRTLMKMTLSADHRIVDGATAARFLNAVRAGLEDAGPWRALALACDGREEPPPGA
jgi:pyruvate dehydrogenase E2 component (dihydrolipoamide acetyltransferase)